jgi:hypothetical protein
VLLVLNAAFILVFRNNLEIILILGPKYVNVIFFLCCVVFGGLPFVFVLDVRGVLVIF